MTKLIMLGAAVALAVSAGTAAAQSKTIPGETRTITGTVETIDYAARQVTVKKSDGTHEVFTVPATVKRFDMLKVGSQVKATHYENIVLQIQPPGAKPVNRAAKDVATPAEKGTGGTIASQRTITATITAIDPKVPSITFTGPQGFKHSTRVKDVEALSKVKVGDKVDITWTEATLVTIEDVK